jgi:hypothetical protein
VSSTRSAWSGAAKSASAGDRSELVGTWFVNTSFFDVFAVQPVAGRTFRPDDVKKAAVVSNGYATQHFGSASARSAGRSASTRSTYDIVGVMPPAFISPAGRRVGAGAEPAGQHESLGAQLPDGRPAPCRRQPAGANAMATLSGQLATTHKDTNAEKTLIAMPLQERMVGSMRLAVPCSGASRSLPHRVPNVANLLLARAVSTRARSRSFGAGRRPLAHPAAARRQPAARSDWRGAGAPVRVWAPAR